MLREAVVASVLVLGGAWAVGGLGGSYSRDVGASPAEVREALADLDIRDAPGAPGTDASRSGGVSPAFQLTQDADSMTWTVMSGNFVATQMTAHLAPLDEGRRTRVTLSVKRGDAPDDFVSPAFRSKGVTTGLFAAVIEDELNDLTKRPAADPEKCAEIMARFEASNSPEPPGFGTTAKMALKLHALEGELRAAGCPSHDAEFQPVTQHLPDDGPGNVDPAL